MWKLLALALGYRAFHDVEDDSLVVYREADSVHYHSWRDAAVYRGK